MLLLGILVFLGGFLPAAMANVPVVVSLRQHPQDAYTLVVTIVHDNPSSEHYVDKIQFRIDNGTVSCPGSTAVDIMPETEEEEFSVNHSCRTPCHLSDPQTPKDRQLEVRAYCNTHGWSEWSNSVEIIEFSPLPLIAVLGALAATALIAKMELDRRFSEKSK
jgi:desulfoferrodoxin (superoxide reductase-like protein)